MNAFLAKTRNGVIYDFYFFSYGGSHCFILVSATTLWKMTGYDLQLHLRCRNSIQNKETEVRHSSYTKMFLDGQGSEFQGFSRRNKEIKYFSRTFFLKIVRTMDNIVHERMSSEWETTCALTLTQS